MTIDLADVKIKKVREKRYNMTLQTFYKNIGTDASLVVNRLGNERFLLKYLKKFVEDNSHVLLLEYFNANDYSSAFRVAHTIKGICLNLELVPLTKIASILTELLRNYTPMLESKVKDYLAIFEDEYLKIVKMINQL